MDDPNENVPVGTGILLGSGCLGPNVVVAPKDETALPNVGRLDGVTVVDVVVVDPVDAWDGDFGKENIPGIADFVATGADDTGAINVGAFEVVVVIGVTPDRLGIAAPNLNPGDAVVVVAFDEDNSIAGADVVVVVLLNVNIAAVGALNPVLFVSLVIGLIGSAVLVAATGSFNFVTLSSAGGCAMLGCGSTAGLIVDTVCSEALTVIVCGFVVSPEAIAVGKLRTLVLIPVSVVVFGAVKLIPVEMTGVGLALLLFATSTTSLAFSSSSSLSSKSPAKHFNIIANLFFSTFRFSSTPVTNVGLVLSCGFTKGFLP